MMALNSPVTPSGSFGGSADAKAVDGGADDEVLRGGKTDAASEAMLVSPPRSPAGGGEDTLRLKFVRANALVASILNKFYNGSSRAVDPFVIRCLQEEETRLFSLQCFVEQGPAENCRDRKDSVAMSNAAQATQNSSSFLGRLFGICGGYMGGPGSVMRQWDVISSHAAGLDDAMGEYVAIVDKILPGWDRPLPHDFPVSQQDKFWKDDVVAEQCQSCGVPFSGVQCRRHHCRLCFDIFCASCCAETIDMALCPGAPIRRQRVCLQCYEEAEKDRSLLEVRRMIRENYDLERKIKDVTISTETLVATKQKEEAKLRHEALQCGCALDDINAEIERRIGSPVSMSVKMPPAHKFTPRETADANEQLTFANRQLLMGLKVAQCRAKKAVEKMEITLRILREAICFGSTSTWNVVLRHTTGYLTLRDIRVLTAVSHTIRGTLNRYKCEAKCVLAYDFSVGLQRPFAWQAHLLKNDRTREYLSDLAEVIRGRMESSDSESEGEGDINGTTARHAVVSHLMLGAHVSPNRRSMWKSAYEFILSRCDDISLGSPAGEFDAQILGDVSRTFGVSSLRSRQHKKNTAAQRKAYQRAGASTLETPLALRKTALTNVLRAFASVNSEIGYCQGMDHVAALLLSTVDWNESDAFWMLTSLVASPEYELDKLYGPGLPHLNMRVFQLEKLLEIHLPELSIHLRETEFPISMVTTTWFMTLFTNMDALSYDLVLRVLDGFIMSGWKFIFRVALTIMEALQHQMLASTFEELPQVFYDIHLIAPEFAGVDAIAFLRKARKYKVTNRELNLLADEYERSGGTILSAPLSRRSSMLKSPNNLLNGVGIAIIGSPTGSGPSSPLSVGSITNGRTSPAKNGVTSPHKASRLSPGKSMNGITVQQSNPTQSSPRSLQSRRSRNSSDASTSSDSGHKSPDTTRAASPAAFLAPPQRYSLSSSSSYGLATPLNASYYF